MKTLGPDMFQEVAPLAIVLAGSFEHQRDELLHADDGWPELSLETQMRLEAFGIVACSQEVQFGQVIFSGGLQAETLDDRTVDESETMEHVFQTLFQPNQRGQLVVTADGDCSTTISSARSVKAAIEREQLLPDSEKPYILVTSSTHEPRARKNFEREGIHVRTFAAEDILVNAAKFGWNNEAAERYASRANDYVHSMRYRKRWITERLVIPLATMGPFENIAERRMLTARAPQT